MEMQMYFFVMTPNDRAQYVTGFLNKIIKLCVGATGSVISLCFVCCASTAWNNCGYMDHGTKKENDHDS